MTLTNKKYGGPFGPAVPLKEVFEVEKRRPDQKITHEGQETAPRRPSAPAARVKPDGFKL